MEGEPLGEDALLWQLRDSRRRFQTRMQRLIEKYNQPFEDAPLVQMSTLTYETPQGLRIWGGGLVKEKNKEQIQDSPVKTFEDAPDSRSGGDPAEAEARGLALPEPSTRVLGVDSKSGDDASLCPEDVAAGTFMPAEPWSPLKNELRRKYLTQVDVLLQDEGCLECTGDGGGEDARVTLSPPLASPAGPAPGRRGRVSGESPGGPVKPASRPCSADLAVVPRSDSVSLQGTGGHSFSSSLSFEPDDICDVTISDLYAGMLHSMSLLLSAKPSCIISTKTSFVLHNWSSRRRCSRSRVNRTHCRGGRRPHRASQERLPVRAGPGRDRGALRDCENVLDASGQKTGLKLDKAFLEVNKSQVLKWGPSWKEFKELRSLTPQGRSLLPYGDSRAVCHLDQKNRYKALKWLISPVKIVSRPRILPGKRGNHYREIEIRFDKLHQEYCPSPRKQPVLTSLPESSAVDVYRGGPASPRGPRGFETRRLSGTFGTAEAKRFNEAFEELGDRARGAGRCLQRRGSPPPLPETSPVQGPRRSEQTLLFQGNNSLGTLRKSASPNRPTSVAGVQPLSCGRDRYKEIKEKFDKLHQKYCQQSPPRTKALLRVGACPDKASLEVRYQRGTLGKLNPDSGFQSPPKLSASPQQSIERPLRLTATEAQPLTCLVLTAARGLRSPPKRRRLSDSVLCGRWASSQDSSRVVGQPIPRPGERSSPHSPAEKKRKEQHVCQDGREK
ncbi:Holliday junction recognition protein [Felis catus]|uniref:Holliday junction recognition protein n=1 Tax=Felis catus TaxID=9685 RepID=A0ABI8A8Z4_FELCA|nr:Holliday junction recognition protein [Felis catus]